MRTPTLAVALALSAFAGVAAAAEPAPPRAPLIRFPGYDPRLGSLTGYRQALIEAVDRHIAAIEAGFAGAWQVQGLDVVIPPAGSAYSTVSPLAPGVSSSGAMIGSVGVAPVELPSSNRMPTR